MAPPASGADLGGSRGQAMVWSRADVWLRSGGEGEQERRDSSEWRRRRRATAASGYGSQRVRERDSHLIKQMGGDVLIDGEQDGAGGLAALAGVWTLARPIRLRRPVPPVSARRRRKLTPFHQILHRRVQPVPLPSPPSSQCRPCPRASCRRCREKRGREEASARGTAQAMYIPSGPWLTGDVPRRRRLMSSAPPALLRQISDQIFSSVPFVPATLAAG